MKTRNPSRVAVLGLNRSNTETIALSLLSAGEKGFSRVDVGTSRRCLAPGCSYGRADGSQLANPHAAASDRGGLRSAEHRQDGGRSRGLLLGTQGFPRHSRNTVRRRPPTSQHEAPGLACPNVRLVEVPQAADGDRFRSGLSRSCNCGRVPGSRQGSSRFSASAGTAIRRSSGYRELGDGRCPHRRYGQSTERPTLIHRNRHSAVHRSAQGLPAAGDPDNAPPGCGRPAGTPRGLLPWQRQFSHEPAACTSEYQPERELSSVRETQGPWHTVHVSGRSSAPGTREYGAWLRSLPCGQSRTHALSPLSAHGLQVADSAAGCMPDNGPGNPPASRSFVASQTLPTFSAFLPYPSLEAA